MDAVYRVGAAGAGDGPARWEVAGGGGERYKASMCGGDHLFAQLDPHLTTWHITWGTYGTRLHGGHAATVDRDHNKPGQSFVTFDPVRYELSRQSLRFPPVVLTAAQRQFIEDAIPSLSDRGGWGLREWAAQPNHVHVVLDIVPTIHGERVRRLLKRWVTQALDTPWRRRLGASWWAEQGSNRVVGDTAYLHQVLPYVQRQRAPRDAA